MGFKIKDSNQRAWTRIIARLTLRHGAVIDLTSWPYIERGRFNALVLLVMESFLAVRQLLYELDELREHLIRDIEHQNLNIVQTNQNDTAWGFAMTFKSNIYSSK